MRISSTVRPVNAAPPRTTPAEPQDDQNENLKDTVTTMAFASGGAFGGGALGSVAGHVIGHASGISSLATVGMAAGAALGVVSGVKASNAEDKKEALKSLGRSYGLATLGSAAGLAGYPLIYNALTSVGAPAIFGPQAAAVGAAVGGLMGAGIAASHENGPSSMSLYSAGFGAGAGLLGASAGMAASIFVPGTQIPLVMGGAGYAVGSSLIGPQDKNRESLREGALLGTAGYAVGEVVKQGMTAAFGPSPFYDSIPALVGASGALMKYPDQSELKNSDNPEDQAIYRRSQNVLALSNATLRAVGGGVVGDLAGLGLTALTGNTAYTSLGAAAGGLVGATSTWSDSKMFPPVATGVGGTALGALAGGVLTSLTGQPVFNTVGPAVGGAAGLLSGAAISLHRE